MKLKFTLFLFLFIFYANAQNITIVSSGGSPENSGWNYSNGIITASTTVSINASNVVSKLSLGNLTIQTNGQITISASITSTYSSALTFKSASNILQSPNANISTIGGAVTYWSDSDASGQGAICIGDGTGGASVVTSGGNITLSGGTDIASGYASSSVGFLPWAQKPYGGVSLFNSSLNAQGGSISIRGALNSQIGNVSGRAVLMSTSSVVTSGNGTVTINGTVTNFIGTNPWAVLLEGGSILESELGNIVVNGTGNANKANTRGLVFSVSNIQSVSGAIQLTDATTTTFSNVSNYYGVYVAGSSKFGKGNLNSSSSVITFTSDKFQFDTSPNNFSTSGSVTFEPYLTTFKNTFDTSGLVFGNEVQELRIGKESNAGWITIGTGTVLDIAGPIRFLNSSYISINATTKTSNNIYIKCSESITQTAPLVADELHLISGIYSLTNASNNVSKLIGGSVTSPINSLDFVNSGPLTVGDTTFGVKCNNALQIATLSGDLTISQPVISTLSTGTSVTLYADKNQAASSACSNPASSGGNIKIAGSGAVTIEAGAKALLYSGSPTNSTGLTTLVGGTNNTRNQIDATTNTATISPSISAAGKYALYRTGLSSNTSNTTYYDFNAGCELEYYFDRGNTGTTAINQATNTGIGGSGAVNIGNASAYEVYTTKQGYSNGGVGSVYEFSTFIKSEYNSGYSAIGFTSVSAQPHANSGNPAVCLGVSVHGGGFIFYNNSTADYGDWQSGGVVNASIFDLLNYGSPDKWYKIVLKITAQANSAYHLRLEIWPSDASGNLLYGSASAVQERTFTNATIANSSVLYSYFGFGGYRVSNFDNYSMNLQGSTVIEQGAPVVVNGTAVLSPVLNNSIDIEGSVTDDRQDPVTERGFVWNTTGNPTINDQKIIYGSGQGNFTGTINNLASGTYYLRAFATNSAGSSYGNEQTVIVPTQPSTISVVESINNFVKTCASLPSESQTFSVSGSNLSSAIEIGSVTGLEYSLNGTTYQNTLTLNPVSGSVAATTVYVRMTSTQISGFTDYISISATGALGYSIAANGTYTASFSVDTQPTVVNSQVCKDTSSETISFTTIGSDFSIQWYSNTTNSYTGATLISGATSNSLSLPTNIVGTKYYFAKLTANSGSCNVDTQVVSQTVIQNIGNIGWISGTRDLASDATTTTYTIPVVSGATSYVWNLPSGMTRQSQTGNSITVAIAASFTSGTISVYAQNNCGVTATRTFFTTKLTGGVSFNVSGSPVICTNAVATYTATAIVNGVYTWTVPSGVTIVSGQGTNEISVSTDSSFTSGNITATSATSQYTYTSSYAVSGVALPSAVSGPINLCGLTTATYSVTNVPGTTYIWSLPEGMVVSGANNTSSINVTISGSVSGTISVQAQNSCGLSTPRYLAVNSAPIVGGINGVNRVCGAVQVTLDNQGNVLSNSALNSYAYSVAAVAGADSYIWSVPTGATIESGQGTNSITVSYELATFESGNITVQAVNSACGAGPIRSLTVSTVTGTITGPTSLCGLTIATYSVPADIGTDFVWTLPEGMSIASGTGTSSITVDVTEPVNSNSSVQASFTTACGGTRSLSLRVSCSDYTNLAVQSCGATLSATTSFIYVATVSGANGYGFEVTYNGTTYAEVFSNDYRFRLSEVTGLPLELGVEYSVRVRAYRQGIPGVYGAVCTVTTPSPASMPTTTLGVQSCGATLSATTSFIYAASVVGVSAYGFEVTYNGITYPEVVSNDYRFRLSEVEGLPLMFGTTYSIRVRIHSDNQVGEYGTACSVTTPSIPVTTLHTQSCGATLSATTSFIYAASVVGANAYEFEVTYDGTTYPTEVSNDYRFRLSEVEGLPLMFGTTYSIRVRIHSDNQVGEYGTACSVTTPSIPVTTLHTQSCGATLSATTSFIYAASVVGANAYEFEVTYDGTTYPTEVSNDYRFRLSEITGLPLVLGGEYSIRVRVHSNNQVGTYGTSCLVFTPGIPTTTLESSQCSTSILFTDLIYANAVNNATGYKFNVYDVTGATLIASYESVTNSFSFSQLTGYIYDTTYQVRVQVIRGTQYGAEGAPCTITLIKEKPTQPTRVVSNNGVVKTGMVSELTAYPNPFTSTFAITPLEGEKETLFYQVYDVTGKMIESRSVEANEVSNHTIGDYYPTGMYLVIVRQGATTQTFKMVKQ